MLHHTLLTYVTRYSRVIFGSRAVSTCQNWFLSLWILPLCSEAMPTRLQCLDVPVVDDEACEKAYPGMISRRMMCAGYMDGGKDACNVNELSSFLFHFSFFSVQLQRFCCCNVFDEMQLANSQSYLPLLVRVTLAAPWCALERSTAWCRGVKDVHSLVTLGSMSRCASSSTGSTTSSKPTPEEVSHFLFTVKITLPPPASSRQPQVYFLSGDKHTSQNVDKINTSWYIPFLFICFFIFF